MVSGRRGPRKDDDLCPKISLMKRASHLDTKIKWRGSHLSPGKGSETSL
uniref:Uncharacterized protein n=1 Tax=Picea glauca TaxID=3330 RepID=A0A124GNV0_PICGL|nr:hypothetical protein ABT39_MTgene3199 [Picea glauca]